jgi:hypothetical protein
MLMNQIPLTNTSHVSLTKARAESAVSFQVQAAWIAGGPGPAAQQQYGAQLAAGAR